MAAEHKGACSVVSSILRPNDHTLHFALIYPEKLLVSALSLQIPFPVGSHLMLGSCGRKPWCLAGPVTILNWSFPRKDITRKAQSYQLALALRQEVAALEEAGCKVIQVPN